MSDLDSYECRRLVPASLHHRLVPMILDCDCRLAEEARKSRFDTLQVSIANSEQYKVWVEKLVKRCRHAAERQGG